MNRNFFNTLCEVKNLVEKGLESEKFSDFMPYYRLYAVRYDKEILEIKVSDHELDLILEYVSILNKQANKTLLFQDLSFLLNRNPSTVRNMFYKAYNEGNRFSRLESKEVEQEIKTKTQKVLDLIPCNTSGLEEILDEEIPVNSIGSNIETNTETKELTNENKTNQDPIDIISSFLEKQNEHSIGMNILNSLNELFDQLNKQDEQLSNKENKIQSLETELERVNNEKQELLKTISHIKETINIV